VDPANGEETKRNKVWEEFIRAEEEKEEEILKETWNGKLIYYSDPEIYRYWTKDYCNLRYFFLQGRWKIPKLITRIPRQYLYFSQDSATYRLKWHYNISIHVVSTHNTTWWTIRNAKCSAVLYIVKQAMLKERSKVSEIESLSCDILRLCGCVPCWENLNTCINNWVINSWRGDKISTARYCLHETVVIDCVHLAAG
jgi:hypothetical protein